MKPIRSKPGAHVVVSGVSFRVWAPKSSQVRVEFESNDIPTLHLTPDEDGFHTGVSPHAKAGHSYWYALDGAERVPDPYSRYQPEGPRGPSTIIDPSTFSWSDSDWSGIDPERSVLYELHIGTFTQEGTYRAAAIELPRLAALGITCIELMPVGEFHGRWGWGYDGTHWYAPFHHYGTPDDLRSYIDSAHGCGLGVILDVVYNHVGAEGNSLPRFSDEFFTQEAATDWGEAFNYGHSTVRRLAIDNAAYWISEFHFDGLRLDAVQGIHDPKHPSLLTEIANEAREAANGRSILLTAEDYLQRSHLLSLSGGTGGFTQVWNDDYHHSLRVALTGSRDGYFKAYDGNATEILSAIKYGFLYQGQYDPHLEDTRGEPSLGVESPSLIVFTQNHDQVANTLLGARVHQCTSPGKKRAMTTLLLLGPNTPLLFMGQEFDSDSPFYYFADYDGAVANALTEGRRKEGSIFEQKRDPDSRRQLPEPCDPLAFNNSKLPPAVSRIRGPTSALCRALLTLRRCDPVLSKRPLVRLEGAVLNDRAFILRWMDMAEGDRLLIVNFGDQIGSRPMTQPLLAPPLGRHWHTAITTDDPQYGGGGKLHPVSATSCLITSESAHLLIAVRS